MVSRLVMPIVFLREYVSLKTIVVFINLSKWEIHGVQIITLDHGLLKAVYGHLNGKSKPNCTKQQMVFSLFLSIAGPNFTHSPIELTGETIGFITTSKETQLSSKEQVNLTPSFKFIIQFIKILPLNALNGHLECSHQVALQ